MDAGVASTPQITSPRKPHPRTIGWRGTAALGLGGSNQSLFLIGGLIAGQGAITGQWSAAIPIMIAGLVLSLMAMPGWIELVLMSPGRVGGIAASCSEAFGPYSPILSALTGICYWWGWVPTCGATAILSATAISQWVLPGASIPLIACLLVVLFVALNLCGIKWVTRVALPVAIVSALLAFVSMLAPIFGGSVNWHQATDFSLHVPFPGWFGKMTSMMAGLYLVGFGAPAFEAATCHVAETIDQNRNVPKAVFVSAGLAVVYFALLPIVWLGVVGAAPLGNDLGKVLGPTFAPLFGSGAKAAAIGFMMFNMFPGTIQPLAGAARVLSQLSEDGLLPGFLALRARHTDVPWVATVVTAGFAILFLLIGDPLWLIAAANFTYLIGIGLPSVAVWLLRRDNPAALRPWRAPKGTITLGVIAAGVWGLSALFGFEQYGLPTVVIGLAFAYSGAGMYALRLIEDRRRHDLTVLAPTLYFKLTGTMLLVLGLDSVGYLFAVTSLPVSDDALIAALTDIFVAVAMISISVGIVLPGMIAHTAGKISSAARKLASGAVHDLAGAMASLARGDLAGADISVDIVPVPVMSRDELGEMAISFNDLQQELKLVSRSVGHARKGLAAARDQLVEAKDAAESGARSKTDFLAVISHELRTPLNGVIGMAGLLVDSELNPQARRYAETLRDAGDHLLQLINDVLDFSKLEAGKLDLEWIPFNLDLLIHQTLEMLSSRANGKDVDLGSFLAPEIPKMVFGDPGRLRQVLMNLVGNSIKFTEKGAVSVVVSALPGDVSELNLCFEVRDTGIGIPADRLDSLFNEFSQIDSSMSRRYGGTGLGLAISRKLVEKMGGRISVRSVLGEGSVFRFTIRLKPSLRAIPAPAKARLFANKRFLVVDDSEMNRDIMARQIESLGGAAVTLADVSEVSPVLKQSIADHAPFDTVVIDHFMPGTDGVTLARQIRSEPLLRNQRLVLASSAHFNPESRRAAEEVFDAILTKPISSRSLSQALMAERRLRPREQVASRAGEQVKLGEKQRRVLVAEDNATNQMVICAMLERLNYKVSLVADGAEAVRALQKMPYDIVLMDVMMPVMDGVAATEAIRALPLPFSGVPILGLTAHASKEDHDSYRKSGMNDVMSKPVTKQALEAALAAHLA